MKLGSGSHVYEIAAGWGKLPSGIECGYTHGIVVDSSDRVYVHNTSKDSVIVFDREGHFLNSWGEDFAEGAHGMHLSKEEDKEHLYLADRVRHIVVKTTLDGEKIFTLGVPDLPNVYDTADKYKPTDVAVAPNGDIYVCDGYGQSWIHQYSADGTWIHSWGGKGNEAGQLDCPHGIWVDTRGNEPYLYVADRANHRIQIFTLDGEHVKFITEDIDYPCDFYQYQGELYIPDLHSRVTILDHNNRLITHLGEDAEAWQKEGWPRRPASERQIDKFVSPHAVCVDSYGDLYVAEWVPDGRITKLIRQRD
jgi:DNA-binding beta-propeller fold protein YncE